MKKIGIITMYYQNFNYGGQLQAYALQKAVEKLGVNCDQICVNYSTTNSAKRKIKSYIKIEGVWFTLKLIGKKLIYWFPNRLFVKKNCRKRMENFWRFSDNIPHSDKVYTWDTIKESEKDYFGYIVGSDQVWNPNYYSKSNFLDINLLKFCGDEIKKMSYAASIGVSNFLAESKEQFARELNRFDYISVREETARNILQSLTGKNIEVVLDPTFLLTKEEWSRAAADYIHKDYIAGYFLGETKQARKNIARVAKKQNKKFVLFTGLQPNFMGQDFISGAVKESTAGPAEWLGIIKNAGFVITNSFHGTVFSILFEKQFVVMITDKSSKYKTGNSRLYDVLKLLGLEDRIVTGELTEETLSQLKIIDYKQVNAKIDQYRESSLSFLKNICNQRFN